MTEVTIYFSQIDEPVPDDLETARIKISGLGQRRHLKVWHDHSDILNRTYFSIMISCIYDRAFYLTNQEYKANTLTENPFMFNLLLKNQKCMYLDNQKHRY
jgi:lipoate-protein ligase A